MSQEPTTPRAIYFPVTAHEPGRVGRRWSSCRGDVVGPLALAQFVLADDGRLIREKILGVAFVGSCLDRAAGALPLEIFEHSVPRFSPKAGVDGVFRSFGGPARRHRVLLDGRIQVVRCLPEWGTYLSLALFTEELLTRHPHWAEPRQRAKLAASAKQCDDAVCGLASTRIEYLAGLQRRGTSRPVR